MNTFTQEEWLKMKINKLHKTYDVSNWDKARIEKYLKVGYTYVETDEVAPKVDAKKSKKETKESSVIEEFEKELDEVIEDIEQTDKGEA